MQEVTGTLSPGGHPGSYNGQDAYNDMLVAGNGLGDRKRTTGSAENGQDGRSIELHARPTGDPEWGGVKR